MKEPVLHISSVHFDRGAEMFGVSPDIYETMEKGFKPLSRRALLMAGPDDAVMLDRTPDDDYVSLLRRCGAGGGELLVPSSSNGRCLAEDAAASPEALEFIREWPGRVEPYMASAMEQKLAGLAGRPLCATSAGVAELLNDKTFMVRLAEDLGLPMIQTYIGPANAVALRLVRDGADPVIVRGSRSMGGARAWIAKDAMERRELSRLVEKEGGGAYLMQPYIDGCQSPNIQLYVGDRMACELGGTIQKLEGQTAHRGNYFDEVDHPGAARSMREQAKALALEAAALGYRGFLGIDFIVSGAEAYAVEINARQNTSTHALWFLNRFFNGDPFTPVESGKAAFVRLGPAPARTASDWLELLGGDAFDPDKGRGVLPYDCAMGELQALAVEQDPESRERLLRKAERLAAA